MLARRRLSALIVGAALARAGIAAPEKENPGPTEPVHARVKANLTFGLSTSVRYDDNILHLSKCDVYALEKGTPYAPCPDDPSHTASHAADRVVSADDNVLLAEFLAKWITRPFPHRNTTLDGFADVYLYSRNPIKNWSEWFLGLGQELSASRKHLSSLRASVS